MMLLDETPYSEMAQALGCSEETLRVRICRTRKALHKMGIAALVFCKTCYYWDADANDYVLYVVEYPESRSIDPERAMRNMHGLFRMATDSEELNKSFRKALRLHQISEIRSWLLINNKCNGPVYIDADLGVTCNGERIKIDSNIF